MNYHKTFGSHFRVRSIKESFKEITLKFGCVLSWRCFFSIRHLMLNIPVEKKIELATFRDENSCNFSFAASNCIQQNSFRNFSSSYLTICEKSPWNLSLCPSWANRWWDEWDAKKIQFYVFSTFLNCASPFFLTLYILSGCVKKN